MSSALAAIGSLLDWSVTAVTTHDDAAAQVDQCNALVVLSHHEGVDGPVIADALASGTPYIAAMGSRTTQQRRRQWLLEHDVSANQVNSVHGPAGLDIGANTPVEIALSIAAEIVASRRGVGGGSLKDRPGPIHPNLPGGSAHCPGEASATGSST